MARDNVTTKGTPAQAMALIDDKEFIKCIVQEALQAILEAEMTEHIGAERYERSDGRRSVRNGYKPRTLELSVGKIELAMPQSRDGEFSTELFGRYQRSEKALVLALMEMYVLGVSTRDVADITEALCGTTFSKTTVSELCRALDAQVAAWKARDLSGCAYPYLFVDAIYEKVRVDGVAVSQGVLIVSAVRSDGRRDLLDVIIADTESEATYAELFRGLKERGVTGVVQVTSDYHLGLKAAVGRYFQGAAWQRCQVHFVRNATGKVAWKHRRQLSSDINAVFAETTREAAIAKAAEVADRWRDTAPSVAKMIDTDIEECLSVLALPLEHRKRTRTNNGIERFNEEIRRRTRTIRVFPNRESALRLIGTLCMEQGEEWITGKRYLDMSLLYAQQDGQAAEVRELVVEEMRKVG